jgi:branched-chain amino acid transport system ATP-binding protein
MSSGPDPLHGEASGPEGAARAEVADGAGSAPAPWSADGAGTDPSTDRAASLTIDGLVAGYGEVIALDGVTLTAGAAAITAVLGANGAGKTTLLRAVSGMIRPRRGRVLLGGTDVAGRSPEQMVRAGIAHVPEGQAVIPELTVEENLRIGMTSWPRRGIPRGIWGGGKPPPRGLWGDGSPQEQGGAGGDRSPRGSRADRAAALDEAYARFAPLAARRRKLASTLSGGERQMLVIARALLARPRVLLLDEPSLGLAPRVMLQVMELVVRLSRDRGLTIVLVEQNARSALSIADHGIVLNLGRVVASADAATLAADVALRHHYLGF